VRIRHLSFLLAFLCASSARAQVAAARVDDIVLTNFGGTLHPGAGLTVTVCTSGATGLPCTPKATIYTNATDGISSPNPFLSDGNGNYGFWAVPGNYVVTITGAIPSGFTKTYALASFNAGITSAGPNALNGTTTVSTLNGKIFADKQTGVDVCAKITAAFAALTSNSGTVDASNFSGNQACASGVTFPANSSITLLLGAYPILGGTQTIFTIPATANVCIRGVGNTQTGGTNLNASGSSTVILWQGSDGCLENVLIANNNGDGLTLQASGTNSILRNRFKQVRLSSSGVIVAGARGVRLIANSATALVSLNTFDHIMIDDFDRSWQNETSGTQGPTDNYISHFTFSGFAGLGTAGINNLSGDTNFYSQGFVSFRAKGITIPAGNLNSFEQVRIEGNTQDVNDAGTKSRFINVSYGECATNTFAATALNISSGNDACAQRLPNLTIGLGSSISQIELGVQAGVQTAASLNAVSSTVVTWPTAFADASYTATCTGLGLNGGFPVLQAITSQIAASVTVQTLSITAAAAGFANIECIGVHP
jgi:hypothetical protein